MKTYHPITLESEPSVIGVNNGVYQCEILPNKPGNKRALEVLRSLYDDYNFDESQPRTVSESISIEYCELLKKAKITDLIQFSPYLLGCYFIVTEKAYQILKKYNLGPTALFIKTTLYTKSGEKVDGDFYMLFQDFQLNSVVDFINSTFYSGHAVSKDKEYIQIGDSTDFRRVNFLNTEELTLGSDFESTIDLFTTRITNELFVSEAMLADFEQNGLTGFRRTKRINEITVAKKL